MANSVTGPVIKVDTVAAITANPVSIGTVVWSGAAKTTSHALTITDTRGNVIIDLSCGVAKENAVVNFQPPISIPDGITCTVIGGGTAYLY
jgi:hypothetical protein